MAADQMYRGQWRDNFGAPDLEDMTVQQVKLAIVAGFQGERGWGVSEKAVMAQDLLVDSHPHLWSQIGYLTEVRQSLVCRCKLMSFSQPVPRSRQGSRLCSC